MHDARRFIFKYQHIADIAPLQLYCSGLIFAPEKSVIREKFSTEIPKWICKLPRVEEFWNAELQTLEGHNFTVTSVALSPDWRWLASGSMDKTIKLWDPATGALQQTLQGHDSDVNSVALSPDGRWLASQYKDQQKQFHCLAHSYCFWAPQPRH